MTSMRDGDRDDLHCGRVQKPRLNMKEKGYYRCWDKIVHGFDMSWIEINQVSTSSWYLNIYMGF